MNPSIDPKLFEASCRQRRVAGLLILVSAVSVAGLVGFVIYEILEPLRSLSNLLQ